ncbi:MAG: sugar phosphate isomerase/epimerase family protein [Verrucomicrobiales bacterium]
MPDDLSRLAVHTITNRPWSTEECIQNYAAAGVRGITFWRYNFEGRDPERIGRQAREAGLDVVAVARGGFFTNDDWWDDNRRAVDETAGCGAPVLVLVCGAKPGQPLEVSRAQIAERLGKLLRYAAERDVKLAIEPLHPMYADDRSAINTIAQAHALCDALGSPPALGIAVDVYHTWWDPDLRKGIDRARKTGRLFSFHICDWLTPTTDLLNDRGLMGEGCIDLKRISNWIGRSGFPGWREVEIFSNRWWGTDQAQYLKKIVAAYQESL